MRRQVVAGLVVLACGSGVLEAAPSHGLSAFGSLKYPAGFTHFDYVNPDAPKGGRIVTIGTEGRTTFDSLNGYILRGEPAQRLDLLFDSLMVRAFDEPDAVYGLVAKSAELAANRMAVTFTLRRTARFRDGTALTGEDVCNTFKLIKTKGHERIRISIRDVKSCTVETPYRVRYDFTGKNVRDLPMIVATLPIFSKAYYQRVDFAKTTLEPPLGSGPYEVAKLKQGQFITYRRRRDYWGRDLPVNRGRYNFDEIKLVYFRDRTAELEALKAGALDLREEFTSKSWKTEYKDLASVAEGRLKLVELPDRSPSGAQGFFLNLRRPVFADVRTRQALDLAFDFEWTRKNLFYGMYTRTQSIFENSTMKAVGPPGEAERALLERFGAAVPAQAFAPAYTPPVSNGSGQDRRLLRQASRLLDAAGWKLAGTRRVNDKGEPLTIQFLIFAPSFERIIAPYVRNLRLIGIDASIRQVEAAQYQERLKRFDFDIVAQRFSMAQTPGVELRAFFGSRAARLDGSFNLSGIANKAVDGLIDEITQARDRQHLEIAARALDRVLRAIHFWVPHWYKASHTIAYWDMFARPKRKPDFARGVLDTWWIDADKAKALRKGP